MDMTCQFPGWYIRLLGFKTRPTSELPFHQFCRENKSRYKVLYCFLPPKQIKGKLYRHWKKHQPVELPLKTKNKIKNFSKFSLERHISKCIGAQKQPSEHSFAEWLNGSEEKCVKTFQGRAFRLPTKVPEIISQSIVIEKSILKRDRSGTDEKSKENRQSSANVSFATNENGDLSPLLYSPPTPFYLSDASDNQLEDTVVAYRTSNLLQTTQSDEVSAMTQPPKHSQKETITENKRVLRQNKLAFDGEFEFKTSIFENSAMLSDVHIQENKLTTNESLSVNTPNSVKSFSQILEPPKFGPVTKDLINQENKRYCLFEDDNPVKPKQVQRGHVKKPNTVKQLIKKSNAKAKTNDCSQPTPQLKKTQHVLLFQEKPESYSKLQKRNGSCAEIKKFNRKIKITNQKTAALVNKDKIKLNQQNGQKSNQEESSQNMELIAQEHLFEDDTEHSTTSGAFKDSSFFVSRNMQLQREEKHATVLGVTNMNGHKCQSNIIESENMKIHKNAREQTSKLETLSNSHEKTKEKNKNKNMHNKQKQMRSNTRKENCPRMPDRDGKQTEQPTEIVKDMRCKSSQSWVFGEASPDNLHEEVLKSPDMNEGTTDILRQILFQLKNTTASSQAMSGTASSPTPSGFSDLSVRSTTASSPKQNILNGKTPTMAGQFTLPERINSNSSSSMRPVLKRLRVNSLCSMFEDSSSCSSAPKARRFLRSENCPVESDFTMLFNSDTFM